MELFIPQLYSLAQTLAEELVTKEQILVTAESCTGGLISSLCTELPGSSRWFHGGIVAYDNAVKQSVLNVSDTVLQKHGAVSSETVCAMAQGGLAFFPSASICVAVSGVAGPTGGTPDKPVGTVWVAVAYAQQTLSQLHHFTGNRHAIRLQTIEAAITLLKKTLSSLC